jgi:hypothetical protein
MKLIGISNVRAAVRLKAVNSLVAAKDNVEPTKASPRSGHCDLAWSSPALRPGTIFAGIASTDASQCNASDLEVVFIPAKRALRPGVAFASLATRHGLCRHCVRRCFSAPCV